MIELKEIHEGKRKVPTKHVLQSFTEEESSYQPSSASLSETQS